MFNVKSLTFEELVSENKREIWQDNEEQWDDFEERLARKQQTNQ